jgi:hypothetical protein
MRKTPEGWQGSVRRMVTLHGAQLDPAAAREVVRYLATHQGLAPEELRPGRFEVESRMIEFRYTADRDTERTCQACHSLGRVITQRRTGGGVEAAAGDAPRPCTRWWTARSTGTSARRHAARPARRRTAGTRWTRRSSI